LDCNQTKANKYMQIDDVAILLIHHSKNGVSHRELQKLLYLAQGFYLANNNGEPLFEEELEAWQYGPVNQTIWHKYKGYGYHTITPHDLPVPTTTQNITAFIVSLLAAFGTLGQDKLIDYSHVDSPWSTNFVSGINRNLPKEDIRSYFVNFASFDEYININNVKTVFLSLLSDRKQYLSGLPLIGDSWISGKAKAPELISVNAAIQFLEALEKSMFSINAKPEIPKLVMGPIPSGGVGIDLIKLNKSMYIHFHNSGSVDVAKESNGHFEEEETNLDLFGEEQMDYLKGFV